MANIDFCEMQFYINYILGIERSAGLKAEKGTILHKVMEILAALKLDSQNHDKPKLSASDKAFGDNPLEIDRDYLLSSSLAMGILDKVFAYYTGKSQYGYTQKDYNDIADWMLTIISHKKGMFDPRKRTIYATEKGFDIPVEKAWAQISLPDNTKANLAIKGTIDLITQVDDNTLEIIDWKTGKRYDWAKGEEKTYEKLCKDQQLMLYYWAAKKLFPQFETILVTIYFINDGGPFTIVFDEKTLSEIEKKFESAFKRIKSNNMPKLVSYTQSSFKCTKLCDYYKNAHPESKKGENICKFIHNELKRIGMDATTKRYTSKEHDVGKYQSPGE